LHEYADGGDDGVVRHTTYAPTAEANACIFTTSGEASAGTVASISRRIGNGSADETLR